MTGQEQGGFIAPSAGEGDPGKCEYLHNPNWRGKLFSTLGTGARRKSFCGACWRLENATTEGEFRRFARIEEHEQDERCWLWQYMNVDAFDALGNLMMRCRFIQEIDRYIKDRCPNLRGMSRLPEQTEAQKP